jgi:uncharacterized GH25 family protein
MRSSIRLPLAACLLGLAAPLAPAHFNMLLPQAHSVKRGEPVTFVYQWGHPFEHQLFDAPQPQSVSVRTPDGKQVDLSKALEKVTLITADKKKAVGYRFRFTPEQRGDHVFHVATPPIWMEENEGFVQDTVQVVLHVVTQKGWDWAPPLELRMVPLTRPYGLQPGMVFQAQVLAGKESKPIPGTLVEVERYNPAPPRELPPDEHITRTVRTDPNGVMTCTLTEPGWWSLTGEKDAGTLKRNDKAFPLKQRCTLWVHVDEKITPAPKK